MKNKQAISLIVLVITIVVMLILAGAIILTLNNSGIIGKAKEAVEANNLKEVQEFATLKWTEAYLDDKRTQEELDQYVKDELIKAGIKTEDYEITVTTQGVEVELKETSGSGTSVNLNHTGTIPEGATYVTGRVFTEYVGWDETNIITYNAGDAFPATCSVGDKYIYGDYEYGYGYLVDWDDGEAVTNENGWDVIAYKGGAVATQVLETINGAPIIAMSSTYTNKSITTLTEGFFVPSTVIDMEFTFHNSTIVSLPSSFAIPNGVWNMSQMFMQCNSLTGTITINANPTDYIMCFAMCNMTNITLTGTSTMLDALRATAQ